MSRPLPKRLIEVDLPIKRISAHARREKSIRHGHISTLHIWWARRPLAACRAVICAALWPDPADQNCPDEFRAIAADLMYAWARENAARGSAESAGTWTTVRQHTSAFALCNHPTTIRHALLDFIADFADWDNSTVAEYLSTSLALTAAANWSLEQTRSAQQRPIGWPGIERWNDVVSAMRSQAEAHPRPLVVDPFAGGGAIPLEALRVGADAFASDLNPVPVLLNKVVLEYLPKYGRRLSDEVRTWGDWIKREAEKELTEFYPKDPDGATPIAYLWARTIRCEGPNCGAEVPLIRAPWLVKKANRSVALQLVPNGPAKRVDFQIIVKEREGWVDQANPKNKIENPKFDGTVKRGSATCLCCGYTTPVTRVREQLKVRHGGANDARLTCVVTEHPNEQMRMYRLASESDAAAIRKAVVELTSRSQKQTGALSLVPNEKISLNEIRRISVPIYGMTTWGDLFSTRQSLLVTVLSRFVREVSTKYNGEDAGLGIAVQTCLAMTVNKVADYNSSLCTWHYHNREKVNHTFARQAIPFVCDFVEVAPFGGGSGNWSGLLDWTLMALDGQAKFTGEGHVECASATEHPLPNDSANCVVTDPPYYDAIPYSHLSDFFYVLFRRSLTGHYEKLFAGDQSPKTSEIVVDRPHELSNSTHDIAFYERELARAFAECRRVLRADGIATIVFASKTTASWEAILKAVVDAGWIITGSWPIDTEMETRVAAQGQARLASSVHLVCRPRQKTAGSRNPEEIGDWRDVLQELPRRIHEWMPRLAQEGVVGADAIFACLGPALEIFSQFARVEKANGDQVTLREYLEHVWAAVSREALSSLITGTDLSSLEADARISAMWLWTLNAGKTGSDSIEDQGEEVDGEDDDEKKPVSKGGYALEYDAARKIAQGLGASLEELKTVIEVSGDQARLLPVSERTAHLFGKDQATAPEPAKRGKKKVKQMDLFAELAGSDGHRHRGGGRRPPGATVLDRVHQSMILFATGRGDALKRFLVDDGIGQEANFWKLAQALSALYPASAQEKRWVDGVLARKKGLGL